MPCRSDPGLLCAAARRYHWPGNAIGFAPTSEVELRPEDHHDKQSAHRLSWCIDHYGTGGYRAGSEVGLAAAIDWEQLVFAAAAPSVCLSGI